jgi:hypothetical protein
MITPAHPKYIQIETTIVCNASCPFCPHKTLTRRPRRMEDSVWKKIIDDTRGLGITYRPFLINEPFSDNRLCEIMRYIRQDDTAMIELNSNGELLKEEKALEVLEIGIDIIRFSIDGYSREAFEKSRVGVDFDKAVERTARFIELAGQKGGAGFVEVRMIDMPHNKHEHQDFIDFWSRTGASTVITELYNWPWDPGVTAVALPCKKVLNEMFFYVNGKATLCCWDSHERGVIGDVNQDSVLDIWNGEVNRRFRESLSQGRRAEILLCSRCDAYKNHQFEGFPQPESSHT